MDDVKANLQRVKQDNNKLEAELRGRPIESQKGPRLMLAKPRRLLNRRRGTYKRR